MSIDPITRQEQFLSAVATGNTANIKPITREEMFLAKAGGQNVTTPEPITRREKLLQGIIDNGGGGGGTTDDFFEQYMARSFTEFESDTSYPIRYGMFRSQSRLVRVSFPNTPAVENEAFRFCAKLEEADLPKAEYFDAYAFASCGKLKRLNVPSLRILRGNTFNQCVSLEDFPYFGNLEEVGGYEFRQCPIKQKVWDFENLVKIAAQNPFVEASAEVIIFRKAINNGLDKSFHGVPNLRVVELYKSFQIGRYAFQNSPNFEALLLRDTDNMFGISNVDVLTSNTNFYVYVPASMLDSYKAESNWSAHPERIRAIEDYPDITGGVYE